MSLDDSPLRSLSSDFLGLFVTGQAFSDVIFAVEGHHVYAHRCVLAARSPFFRTIFCGDAQAQSGHSRPSIPQVIPVGIVGYDVFILLLQFLYSGNLSFSPKSGARGCKDKTCWHTHCSSAVEFGLETLNAAHFFGVDQLSALTQKHLATVAEKASIEDVMRILIAARKQDGPHLWTTCSKLVGKSGLSLETLQKHLPAEVVTEIESIRQKSGYGRNMSASSNVTNEQRTKKMQKALDSSDVELVKMMVMGEGLNLDKSFGLHYAVSSCSRKVVKTLLELGAADVNLGGLDGRAPLHIAAQLGDPEKIAMLLDNHADPYIRTATGATAMDIVQSVAAEVLSVSGYNTKGDHNRLKLCLELFERALGGNPPVHSHMKLESGSSASILTEHGSSTLMPEDSDNFQATMNRMMGVTSEGALPANFSFYPSLSQSHSQINGHIGSEIEKGETSDSSRYLDLTPLEITSTEQHLQSESRSLTGTYSILDSSNLDDRPRNMLRYPEVKDLSMLKGITNETMDGLKNFVNPNFTEEEVSSGWQLFLQEQSDAL